MAAVAEGIASTCSRDPTPVSQLTSALNSQYSWIVENRHIVANEMDYKTALGKALDCWVDGLGCGSGGARTKEVSSIILHQITIDRL